ncbi:hypothetical protein JCM14076_05540 [Methylosoma difficile]
MLTFQIREEVKRILESFIDAQYFFDSLDSINSAFPPIDRCINNIAINGGNKAVIVEELRANLSTTKKLINNVKPRSFFASIEKIKNEISQAKLIFSELSQLEEIETNLETLSHSYESFIENYSPESAWTMIKESKSISPLLDGFKKGLSFYLSNSEYPIPSLEAGRELSIVLSSSMSLSEFISKLQAIEEIYKELCILTKVSISEFPIEILKIESGSLLAKVFGNSKVIALLTSLITSGVTYIYSNYSQQGQLVSLPQKVETIESILELRAKLKAEGIAVEEMDENINKASVLLSKELNRLISGQPEIIINNRKLSVGDEIQKQLTQSKTALKIGFDDKSERKDYYLPKD